MSLGLLKVSPSQRLIVVGSCLFLSACNTASQPDIAAEINALVKIGTPQAMAVRRVNAAGFACSPADGGLSCSRHVNRNILVSCNQRVDLRIDARSSVTAIDVPEPACFGGFG